jgi:hypothetical protein
VRRFLVSRVLPIAAPAVVLGLVTLPLVGADETPPPGGDPAPAPEGAPAPAPAPDAAPAPGAAPGTEAAPARLEKHPYADAKPGEWRRVKVVAGGEEKFNMERVLAVHPGGAKVFIDVVQTSADGSETKGVVQKGRWIDVPKFAPVAGQTFEKDEMVWHDAGGKRVAARHFRISEQVNPPYPAPMRRREVWYSNDVLGNGKVEERVENPATVLTTLAWGTMSADDLAKARAEYRLDANPTGPFGPPAGGTPTPAPKPSPAPPPGGGGASCGGAGGCGK